MKEEINGGTILILAAIAFVILKLTGIVTWEWWQVLIPVWIWLLIATITTATAVVVSIIMQAAMTKMTKMTKGEEDK